MHRYEFKLWYLHEQVMDIFSKSMDSIWEAKDYLNNDIWRPGQQSYRGYAPIACPPNYSSYAAHQPQIGGFAQASPENWAQAVMFAPLTANTNFYMVVEGFPSLMKFLRTKGHVTQQEVAAFISGLGKHGNLIAAIADRGGLKESGIDAWKTRMIAQVWNARKELKDRCDELNDKNDMASLLSLLGSLPGMKPVKAGFVIQLIYGKLGCLDTHNIDMYQQIAHRLGQNKIAAALDEKAVKKWSPTESGKVNPEAIKAYLDLLKMIEDAWGISTGELWDLWVDLVAQLWGKTTPDGTYSPENGPALDPDNPKYKAIKEKLQASGWSGGWTKRRDTKGDVDIHFAGGHPSGGSVSLVHHIASLTPEEITKGWNDADPQVMTVINSVTRDRTIEPLIVKLSNILGSDETMQQNINSLVSKGKKVNAARIAERKEVDRLKDQYVNNLKMYLQHKGFDEKIANKATISIVSRIRAIFKRNLSTIKGLDVPSMKQIMASKTIGLKSDLSTQAQLSHGKAIMLKAQSAMK